MQKTELKAKNIKDLVPEVANRYLEKTITKSQRCQRNWDLSKSIPVEDIKTMKTSVTQCSSKQNRVFYKAKFITNRDIIKKIYNLTGGDSTSFSNSTGKPYGEDQKNPQTLANLLVAFVRDTDPSEGSRTIEEVRVGRHAAGSGEEHPNVVYDRTTALGIAAGYLTLTSNMLGYSSGCCACGDMGKISELLGETEPTMLLMGIGYPDDSKARTEHHNTGKRFRTLNKNIIVEDVA